MKVYVIRHGESENNLLKRWTGWHNAVLTEKGRADALKARDFLQGIPFDKVYASDLARAMETAQIALPGAGLETSPLVREINVGALENREFSTLTTEERTEKLKDGFGHFGGESHADLQARVVRFQKELEPLAAENVAIFSHSGWMKSFLDAVVGVKLPRKNVLCANCAVAIFEYEDKTWRLHSWINLS